MNAPTAANYSEVVLFKSLSDVDGWKVIDTNLDEDTFNNVMRKIAQDRHIKFHEKAFKSYTKGDVICENRGNEDIRVIQKKYVKSHTDAQRSMVRMYYDMSKIPFHQFPSTMHINDISYIKRMSAKVHNRVSIHFETSMNPSIDDNKITRRIFVSCNSEGNVDVDNLEYVLQGLLSKITTAQLSV